MFQSKLDCMTKLFKIKEDKLLQNYIKNIKKD